MNCFAYCEGEGCIPIINPDPNCDRKTDKTCPCKEGDDDEECKHPHHNPDCDPKKDPNCKHVDPDCDPKKDPNCKHVDPDCDPDKDPSCKNKPDPKPK